MVKVKGFRAEGLSVWGAGRWHQCVTEPRRDGLQPLWKKSWCIRWMAPRKTYWRRPLHSANHSLHPRGCAKAKHHATVRKRAAPEHHPLLNDCFSVHYMAATDADPTVGAFWSGRSGLFEAATHHNHRQGESGRSILRSAILAGWTALKWERSLGAGWRRSATGQVRT